MGGLTATGGAYDSTGIGFPDIGSLFGSNPVSVETGWKWKPPGPEPRSAQLSKPRQQQLPSSFEAALISTRPIQRVLLPNAKHNRATYIEALKKCSGLQDVEAVHRKLQPDGLLASVFSRCALERLVAIMEQNHARKKHSSQIAMVVSADVFEFLQSDLDDPNASNMEAVLAWAKDNLSDGVIPNDLLLILCDKMELRTIKDDELESVLTDIVSTLSKLQTSKARRRALWVYEMLSPAVVKYLSANADSDTGRSIQNTLISTICDLEVTPASVALAVRTLASLPDEHMTESRALVARYIVSLVEASQDVDYVNSSGESIASDLFPSLVNQVQQISWPQLLAVATEECFKLWENSSPDNNLMTRWLSTLATCQSLDQDLDGPLWHGVYNLLARERKASYFAGHFAEIGSDRAARVVLLYWQIPQLPDNHEAYRVDRENRTIMNGTYKRLLISKMCADSFEDPHVDISSSRPRTISIQQAYSQIMNSDLRARQHHGQEITITPFTNAVVALSTWSTKLDLAIHDLFQLLIATQTPFMVFQAFMVLNNKCKMGVPHSAALAVIESLLDTDNAGWAACVFRSREDIRLSSCPELLLALARSGCASPTSLFEMLNRPEPANSIPVRDRSYPTNTISLDRAALVEELAFAHATSQNTTPRKAFRRVWECYRYLRDRRTPFSALISRAFVHAGVTRYLQASAWVSTVRFDYILEFVRELEGKQVADQIDQLVFVWRNKVCLENARGIKFFNKRAAETVAGNIRWHAPHGSIRWKRRTALWKPEAKDVKTAVQEKPEAKKVVLPQYAQWPRPAAGPAYNK